MKYLENALTLDYSIKMCGFSVTQNDNFNNTFGHICHKVHILCKFMLCRYICSELQLLFEKCLQSFPVQSKQ